METKVKEGKVQKFECVRPLKFELYWAVIITPNLVKLGPSNDILTSYPFSSLISRSGNLSGLQIPGIFGNPMEIGTVKAQFPNITGTYNQLKNSAHFLC